MDKYETHKVVDLTPDKRCVRFFVDGDSALFAYIVDLRAAVTVGDALCIRDELIAGGFVFGKDFVIKKIVLG